MASRPLWRSQWVGPIWCPLVGKKVKKSGNFCPNNSTWGILPDVRALDNIDIDSSRIVRTEEGTEGYTS
jgi:hypothetical protein